MTYAFSENYVLPISHDEVVHGKKSLLDKMPGNIEDKFANLRAFWLYMFAHPGKKLNFMGNEYGQFKEWDYKEGLEFFMTDFPLHKKLLNFKKKLNKVYQTHSPLYEIEDSWEGFEWVAVDERDNNVIAFNRKDKSGNILTAIINFSGYTFKRYRLGVDEGEYQAILSSDDKRFGGQANFRGKTFKSVKVKSHGKENSIHFTLPKFTGIYFIKKDRNI